MRLSEAIRKGSGLRQQGMGKLFSDGKSCALGAAYEGAIGTPMNTTFRNFSSIENGEEMGFTLRNKFPILATVHEGMSVLDRIWRMNDDGATREQIADWVEREIESKLPKHARESDQEFTSRILRQITDMAEA